MRIGDICRRDPVYTLTDRPIVEAAERMRRFHIGDLVVCELEDGHPMPVGMLTDRDITVGVVATDAPDLGRLLVGDVVGSRPIVTADEDDALVDVIHRMQHEAIRRIPVVDERGVLVGIFTFDDAVGQVADRLRGVLRHAVELEYGDAVELDAVARMLESLRKLVRGQRSVEEEARP